MKKETLKIKETRLQSCLAGLEKVAVAFSGGIDSSFLLYMAYKVLGKDNIIAVTANSEIYPEKELKEAVDFAKHYGIKHNIFSSCELSTINKMGNPIDRCYYCKKEIFLKIIGIAHKNGFQNIVEGSNKDDEKDYRPGRKALKEFSVISPLLEAGLKKEDIRILAKKEGLSTWNKPAYACLASRFPYLKEIKKEALQMVEKAEAYLVKIGFNQCRVRCFGDKAQVEVEKDKLKDALSKKYEIISALKEIGFKIVIIDPDGYRKGRMNTF